jgi:hypothetical protein
MRTEFTPSRLDGGNLTMLSDVSAALAAPVDAALTPLATKAASKPVNNLTPPAVAIPALLLASVHKTLDEVFSHKHAVEPVFGASLSAMMSALNSVVKRSGCLIEKSIAAGLKQRDLIVFTQVAMHLTDAAKDLVSLNAPDVLRGVAIRSDAPANVEVPLVIFDMLVFDPKTGRAKIIEVKRGNGKTELRKIKPITATLIAGSLQVASLLKAKGLKIKSVEARVIDYYGHSGFPDHIRLPGSDLDRYFGADVQSLVEATQRLVTADIMAEVPDLLGAAMRQARGLVANDNRADDKAPVDLVTLPGGARVSAAHLPVIETAQKRRSKRG